MQCFGCGCELGDRDPIIRPRAAWGDAWFRTGHGGDVFCHRSCAEDAAEYFGLPMPDWSQED
jgi:hypothetical protein